MARPLISDAKKWTASELEALPQITMWAPVKYNAGYRTHPSVELDGIEIDAELAPLLSLLWERGIRTAACCQGYPLDYHVSMGHQGHAYILFCDFGQAVEFLRHSFTAERFRAPDGTRSTDSDGIALEPCNGGQLGKSLGESVVRFAPLLIDDITDVWREQS